MRGSRAPDVRWAEHHFAPRRFSCSRAGKNLTVKCPSRVQKDAKFAFENVMNSLDKRWVDQPYPSQAKIYEMVAKPMIKSSIDGYNTTIVRRLTRARAAAPLPARAPLSIAVARAQFAYGQTGSGKTHTMFGVKDTPEAGIQPRVFEDLFAYADSAEGKANKTEVTVSYLEVYQDHIYDLLQARRAPMRSSRVRSEAPCPPCRAHPRAHPVRRARRTWSRCACARRRTASRSWAAATRPRSRRGRSARTPRWRTRSSRRATGCGTRRRRRSTARRRAHTRSSSCASSRRSSRSCPAWAARGGDTNLARGPIPPPPSPRPRSPPVAAPRCYLAGQKRQQRARPLSAPRPSRRARRLAS